jgi:hypothetical protein
VLLAEKWLVEFLHPTEGWLIFKECDTEDEAIWWIRKTASVYQRRKRRV